MFSFMCRKRNFPLNSPKVWVSDENVEDNFVISQKMKLETSYTHTVWLEFKKSHLVSNNYIFTVSLFTCVFYLVITMHIYCSTALYIKEEPGLYLSWPFPLDYLLPIIIIYIIMLPYASAPLHFRGKYGAF